MIQIRDTAKSIVMTSLLRFLLINSFFLAISSCASYTVTHWDGYSEWTFKIYTYDKDSLTAIPNALARVIVVNEDPFGDIESFVKEEKPQTCATDVNGLCELTSVFNTYGNKSIYNDESFINFRHRNLSIKAEGYHSLSIPIKTFIETPLELPLEQKDRVSTIDISMENAY